MWRVHGAKVTRLTVGGLTGRWKQSMKPVVTTNGEKSAEAVVQRCRDTEGRAESKEVRVNESY